MIKRCLKSLVPRKIWRYMSDIKWRCIVLIARYHHWKVRSRIRAKVSRGEKIKVAFIDTETSKWKAQSLYELMRCDSYYDPVIALNIRDRADTSCIELNKVDVVKAMDFYRAKGDACVNIYDPQYPKRINFSTINPDLIFYQQSWIAEGIIEQCKTALTCYIPYYVINYGFIEIDAKLLMHRFLAYFFMQSEEWINALTGGTSWGFYSGKLVAVGHTALDAYYLSPPAEPKKQCVIYAPHFSFKTAKHNNYTGVSTFPWTGMAILEYAKKHPEMNWIFKPHPSLYNELISSDLMTLKDVDAYYSSWGEFGAVCTDGNYQDAFREATVMITDSCSFLTEFGSLGRPIVHLVSSTARSKPLKPSQDLYSTYYQVHNLDEMYKIFEMVLERQEDPQKEVRHAAVRKAGLQGNYAAKKIMDFFDKEFKIKR